MVAYKKYFFVGGLIRSATNQNVWRLSTGIRREIKGVKTRFSNSRCKYEMK